MAIKGYEGSITLAAGAVGNAKAWSLDIASDTVDTTTFASNGWKESGKTLSSWSGSMTVVFDTEGTAEGAIVAALQPGGAAVALEMQIGAAVVAGNDTHTGNANITSMSVTNDVNGIVEASINFEGTGALTTS